MIAEGNIRKDYEKMSGLIANTIKSLEKLAQQKDGLSGIPSGFTALDRVTSGFQPSDLIILAARPGMGKTAFVLSLARNAAVDHKKPVAVFSLEMSAEQLVKRLIASETGIESQKLKTGKLEQHEWQQLHSRIARLSEAKLFIDDTAALSVFELRAKCRRLKAEHNIEMIVIDYLQLMTIGGETKGAGTREQEISTISRSIKGIAKELNVPIIALSQLSRASETRSGTKRPQLSDLRDSGAIEQDADIVMFIYRPEYHGFDKDTSGNAYTHGHTDIIIAKHRNGALDDIPLKFIDRFAKFTDLDFNDMDYSLPPMPGHESRFEDETDGSSFTLPSKMNDSDNEEQRDTPF
jgi:replicative DNA helicase